MRAEPSRVPRSVQSNSRVPAGVVTDASADVPSIERHSAAWSVVPEVWDVDSTEHIDLGEQSRQLIRGVLRDEAASAQAATEEAFQRAYEELFTSGVEHIWSIHGSANLSSAAAVAQRAAADDPRITVVQTSVTSIGVGLLARRVLQLATEGHPFAAIDAYVQRHAASVQFIVVPDHFDPMGGRRMMADRLLSGNPMLRAHEGQLARSRRLRSRRATIAAIERYVAARAPEHATIRMAIGHGDAAGAIDPFLDIIERLRPHASIELVGRIGPRVVQQIGARCVGLAWIVE